jgi:hypothetical protein
MIALGKINKMFDQADKKNIKQDCGPFEPTKDSHEALMDEMSRLIRNLKNKMSRFEMENGNSNKVPQEGGVRNPNQFRRHSNPQLMGRERINDEQPIQPPVRVNNENNLIEEETNEGYVETPEEMCLLQGEHNTINLTQYD